MTRVREQQDDVIDATVATLEGESALELLAVSGPGLGLHAARAAATRITASQARRSPGFGSGTSVRQITPGPEADAQPFQKLDMRGVAKDLSSGYRAYVKIEADHRQGARQLDKRDRIR